MKTMLITGASSGIGKATALAAANDDQVDETPSKANETRPKRANGRERQPDLPIGFGDEIPAFMLIGR